MADTGKPEVSRHDFSIAYDGTALVWQVFGPVPAEHPAADFATLWADLARDGLTAHRDYPMIGLDNNPAERALSAIT